MRGATSVAVRTRQFSQDLQPIFDLNCTNGCHQPSGIAPFSLELGVSYDSLLSGGLVVPGNPDSSELIRRLEGTSGQRMPLNATPLPDDQIQMFRQWISAGAPNDTN